MQLANARRLLERLDARAWADQPPFTVPAERYTSPAWFERECALVAKPRILGAASAFVEGACVPFDHAIAVRCEDGVVRAFANACRHRGTRLVDAPCAKRAFVCPYHGWTYDLTGKLIHVPHEDTFAGQAAGRDLRAVPISERHGLVWAGSAIAEHLGELDADVAALGLERYTTYRTARVTLRCNWKLVMDAFLEGYHVKSLHQRTLARFFLEDVVTDRSGPHIRSVGARKNLPELRGTSPSAWDFRSTTTPFYAIFPNNVLVLHPETVSHIALYPKGLGEVEYIHTMLAPRAPENETERAGWQKTWELIDQKVFAEEDLAIAESVQSVLHSGANTSFQLCTLEHAIRWFHDETDRVIHGG